MSRAIEQLAQAVARAWGLSDSELAGLIGAPDIERDRLRGVYLIHTTLADLFVDPADEARWIRDKAAILDALSPLDCMLQHGTTGVLRVQEVVERMANRR